MPRTTAQPWEKNLRAMVKQAHGPGWRLIEHRGGRTRLTRAYSDGSRASVTVALPWSPTSGPALLALLERLDQLAKANPNLPLAEAARRVGAIAETASAATLREGTVDWPAMAEGFRRHLVETAATVKANTWERTYRRHVGEAVVALTSKPAPRTGQAVLEQLLAAHPTTPGGTGRRERLGNAARFLKWAVDHGGAPERFRPPTSRRELVGRRPSPKESGVPIRDDQGLRIYRAIEDPQWRLAWGLLVVFGLRPAELGACKAEGQALRVGGVKANAAGGHVSRLVQPLDPIGAPGLGAQLLAMLAERGADALPKRGVAAYWSTRMLQQLVRHTPAWGAVLEEAAATGQGHITVYSTRHGFAWRGGQAYGLTPRVLASLMGHTVQVHLRHYGQGAADDEIATAVDAARARVNQGPVLTGG
jgi:integrase